MKHNKKTRVDFLHDDLGHGLILEPTLCFFEQYICVESLERYQELSLSMKHEFNQEFMNSIAREPRAGSACLDVTRYARRMGAIRLNFV